MANNHVKFAFWCLLLGIYVAPILSEGRTAVTPRLDRTVMSPNGSKYGPTLALPGGGVLVADQGPRLNKVMKLDHEGRLVPPVYTCQLYGGVTGLMLDGDALYVIQYHGSISKTRLSNFSRTENDWRINYGGRKWGELQGHRSNLRPGVVVGRELYLLDAYNSLALTFRPGRWRGRKTIRTTGLRWPVSLKRALIGDDYLFFISEYMKGIKIYNSTWDLINTIEVHSYQILVTPWSTILVADPKNNRIAEYSLSGVFIRDLLTSRDGLYKPEYISHSHPFLWVTQTMNGTDMTSLKRYRFQE